MSVDTHTRIVARLARIRQPEYTGANRCVPCTLLNVAIAAILASAVAAVKLWWGLAVAVPMVLSIILRGYLIPGTPTITTRYFPDWILQHFDHHETATAGDGTFDPEAYLFESGVLRDDPTGQEAILDPTFEAQWLEHYDAVHDDAVDTKMLATLLELEPDRLGLDWRGAGFVATLDDRWLGQWESRVAFLADIAADAVLSEHRPEWNELPLANRSNALGVLRLFVTRCPACDGRVALDAEKRQSCCREIDVIATTCRGCNVRLFEAPYDPTAVADLEADHLDDSS